MPYLVLIVVPSTIGSKSRCTPSRETSPPFTFPRAQILSISSMKTMPSFSTAFKEFLMILSSSIILFDSSSINVFIASSTVMRAFLVFSLPMALPIISEILIMPTCPPGISKLFIEFEELSTISSSISLSFISPSSSIFENFSRVSSRAVSPTKILRIFFLACFSAFS